MTGSKIFKSIIKRITNDDPSICSVQIPKPLDTNKLQTLLNAVKNSTKIEHIDWASMSDSKEGKRIKTAIEWHLILNRLRNKDPFLCSLDLSFITLTKKRCLELLQCIKKNKIVDQIRWKAISKEDGVQDILNDITMKVFEHALWKIVDNDPSYTTINCLWLAMTPTRLRVLWNAVRHNDYICFAQLDWDNLQDCEEMKTNIKRKLILNRLKNGNITYVHLDLHAIALDEQQLSAIGNAMKNNGVVGHVTWGVIPKNARAKAIIAEIEKKIIHNNEKYEYHPTDFVHGLLSHHVYLYDEKSDHEGGEVKFASECVGWNRYLKGWKIEKVCEDKTSGFRAIFYAKKNYLVVSFRGTTVQASDMIKKHSALQTDIKGVVKGYVTIQQILAYKIAMLATKCAKGRHISVTGHSLGGWLAQLSTYYCVMDMQYPAVKTVVFDSPGVHKILKKGMSNIVSLATKDNSKHLLDITTYVGAPNLVNCCNPHLGRVIRVFPKVKAQVVRGKFLQKLIDLASEIKLTQKVHGLTVIIKTFNPKTGLPNNQVTMQDWPCINYESSKHNSSVSVIEYFAQAFFRSTSIAKMPMAAVFLPRLIKKIVPDIGCMSLIHLFLGYLSNKLSDRQFAGVLNHLKGKNYTIANDISPKNAFQLRYEDHYAESARNDYFDILDSNNRGGVDWFLKHIEAITPKDDFVGGQIKNLKVLYKITFVTGKQYIVTSAIRVAILRQRMQRLIDAVPNLRKYITHSALPIPKIIADTLPDMQFQYFIKRPHITEQIRAILSQENAVVISGRSGSGKRSCVYEYAQGNNAVTRWFSGEGNFIQNGFEILAEKAFGMKCGKDKNVFLDQLYSKLEASGNKFLFVFENVKDYEEIRPYIANISDCINIIILATQNLADCYINTIELPCFTADEIGSYIRKSLIDVFDDDEIDECIAAAKKQANILPKMLSMAISYVSKKLDSKVQDFINVLCSNRNALFDAVDKNSISWKILQCFILFDVKFIPFRLLKKMVAISCEIDNSHMTTLSALLEDIEKNLISLSIADRVTNKAKITGIAISDVVFDDFKRYMNTMGFKQVEKYNLRFNIVRVIEKLLPEPSSKWKRGITARKVQSNARAASKILKVCEADNSFGEKDEVIKALCLVRRRLAKFYLLIGQRQKSIDHFLAVLEEVKRIYGNDHEQIAISMEDIAEAYAHNSAFQKGLQMQKRALQLWENLGGLLSVQRAHCLNKMGTFKAKLGLLDEAIKDKSDALNMLETITGESSLATFTQLVELAKAFVWEKRYKEALQLFFKAKAICSTLDPNAPKAYLCDNMAYLYEKMKNIKKAQRYRYEALAIYEKIYPDGHSNTLHTLRHIGKNLVLKGNLQDALKIYKRAYRICELIYKNEGYIAEIKLLLDLATTENALKKKSLAMIHAKNALFAARRVNIDGKYIKEAQSIIREIGTGTIARRSLLTLR